MGTRMLKGCLTFVCASSSLLQIVFIAWKSEFCLSSFPVVVQKHFFHFKLSRLCTRKSKFEFINSNYPFLTFEWYISMKLHTPFVKPLNASMRIKISYRLFKNNLDPKAMPNLSHFWVKLEYFKRCLPSFWLESHVQNIGRIFVTFQKQTSLYIYQSVAWGVVSKNILWTRNCYIKDFY